VRDDDMMQRPPLDRPVRWLCQRGSAALSGMFLLWFVGWTAAVYLLLDWIVADVHQQGLADISAPLMTAFGALFAFLTAFVITIEWNQHRDVERIVGQEADACVLLIWASDSPGCDGSATRALLVRYLQSVRYEEWPTLAAGGEGCPTTNALMIELQRDVRAMAARPDVPGFAASGLAQAADAMAATRADRVNAAGHDLTTPLFLLAFLAGVMLTLNAVALSLHLERGYSIVIGGLVILVAMDLALLVALSTPFAGALRVHGRPLARVLDDLEAGDYGKLAGEANAT
jgi:hypothetical protein